MAAGSGPEMTVHNGHPAAQAGQGVYFIGGQAFSEPQLLDKLHHRGDVEGGQGDNGVQGWETFREAFLKAGCEAVENALQNDGWVQVSLRLAGPPDPDLYAAISASVAGISAGVGLRNMFFMHKPPGLRLRYQCIPTEASRLREELKQVLEAWREEGHIQEWSPEIYEPETTLFGGVQAMTHVHRVFSCDSRYWLRQHAAAKGETEALLVSLVLLRTLFAGMGIVDWEDLGVWERVRSRTGRRFPAGVNSAASEVSEMGGIIVGLWNDPSKVFQLLSPDEARQLDQTAQELAALASAWKADVLDAGLSSIGPRAAAALATIFLFNRAGVALEKQILATEALATRKVMD